MQACRLKLRLVQLKVWIALGARSLLEILTGLRKRLSGLRASEVLVDYILNLSYVVKLIIVVFLRMVGKIVIGMLVGRVILPNRVEIKVLEAAGTLSARAVLLIVRRGRLGLLPPRVLVFGKQHVLLLQGRHALELILLFH